MRNINMNTYNDKKESITHNTEDITRGKPQPKTPTLYYHTSANMSGLHKALARKLSNSQYNPSAAHIQLKASQKPSPLPSKCPISMHNFPRSSSCNLCDSHLTHKTDLWNNYVIMKEIIPSAWTSFLYRKIPPTDSTLSLPLIATGSFFELTCMSYLWENIQLSGEH